MFAQADYGSEDARTALVVEDDPDLRETICEVLEDAGYRTHAAEHGREALDLLRSGTAPTIIVLDLVMPVMDGWSFMAELKKDPALRSIPVVVTTRAGHRVLSSAPVSAGYLDKPLSRDRLLQTVDLALLRKRRPTPSGIPPAS